MSGKVSDNIGRSSGSITEPAGGVEILSSDPTLSNGLVWYNSTSNVLKVARTAGTWSSGGTSSDDRYQTRGCGTLAAGLSFSGQGSGGRRSTSEEYDGASWAAGNSLSAAKLGMSRAGTMTAAVGAGGQTTGNVNVTEEYDGTNWAAGGNLLLAKHHGGDDGTQTAAWTAGGDGTGAEYNDKTEHYDGTCWTADEDILAGRNSVRSGLL